MTFKKVFNFDLQFTELRKIKVWNGVTAREMKVMIRVDVKEIKI